MAMKISDVKTICNDCLKHVATQQKPTIVDNCTALDNGGTNNGVILIKTIMWYFCHLRYEICVCSDILIGPVIPC